MKATEFDFVLAPRWDDPPYYLCACATLPDARLAERVDWFLGEQNDEYRSRRKSARIGNLIARAVPADFFASMDRQLTAARGSRSEQYKRPHLLTPLDDAEALLSAVM